jgi:hypothetical protein
MKFFSTDGGLTKTDVNDLVALAQDEARGWFDLGILPPSSGNAGVLCSERVSRYLARCRSLSLLFRRGCSFDHACGS